MSQINVNSIKNKSGEGAPNFPNGATVVGVVTATSFVGGIPITSGADNRVITASSASAIQGESNLTFDSSTNKLALTASDSYVNIGSNSKRTEIRNNTSSTYLYSYADSTFHVALAGSGGTIQFDSISKTIAQFKKNAECSLFYDNTKRFETTNTGASVTGDLSVSGSLGVGGTVTYEDVTNVDSVGIVTARSGIDCNGDIDIDGHTNLDNVSIAGVTTAAGDIDIDGHTNLDNVSIAGVTTAAGVIEGVAGENKIPSLYANLAALPSASTYHGMFAHVHSEGKGYFAHGGNWMELVNKDTNGVLGFTGALKEQVKITAGKLSDNTNIDLTNGMVHYFTTQETTTSTPNIRFSSSVTLNSAMAVGETISVTIVTTAAAAGYSAQLTIDGSAVTENWVGGSAPSDGGSSGVDIYTYNIIKTASATFTVIGNQTKTS